MKTHSNSILALVVLSLVVAVFITPSSRRAQATAMNITNQSSMSAGVLPPVAGAGEIFAPPMFIGEGSMRNRQVATTVSGIVTSTVFLPAIFRDYCPQSNFFDDFSIPTSGWPVGEDEFVRAEYLDGEYRILSKQAGHLYFFRAPTCMLQNYQVEVDVRWVGLPGGSYGLLYGITADFSRYYFFEINTDYLAYRVYRYDASGFTPLVPFGFSPAINSGTASNHLKVIRETNYVMLEINGRDLGGLSSFSGLTGVGLMMSSYVNGPTADARFDNFSVTRLQSFGISNDQSNVMTRSNGPVALMPVHVTLPPKLEWRLPVKPIPQERK